MVAVKEPNPMNPRFFSRDQLNRNNQKQRIDLTVLICLSLKLYMDFFLNLIKKKCKWKNNTL